MRVGINGFGRIGKLTVWYHIEKKFFDGIVVNIGREAGISFESIVHYLERDSTYGFLHNYLYGCNSKSIIENIDTIKKSIIVDGIPIYFLTETRNPGKIDWKNNEVRLVVDTTGQFLDPSLSADYDSGSLRSHFKSGVEKIIVSAPFDVKMNNKQIMLDDVVTTVMGINANSYDPKRHRIISNASCTTTCLAHMMKPLLNVFGARRILSASMATVHSTTGSQQVLDRLPKAGKIDLRKNRSILNNIILTSTGAARALRLVIPEMEHIGFIAESVRVPIIAGSLIILVLSIQDDPCGQSVNREVINKIYRDKAKLDFEGYLQYTEKQNVSVDILGMPKAGAIIEAHETHTRTAEIRLDLSNITEIPKEILESLGDTVVRVPVTQAVIYGWYDNEMKSYVSLLGDRTITIAKDM